MLLNELYASYYGEIVAYATRLCRVRAQAEDIAQDTFLRAVKNADTLMELNPHQCRAWLYKTARNLYVDCVRKAANAPILPAEQDVQDDLSGPMVAQALDRLPEKLREVVLLRHFTGLNSTEIANYLNIPAPTVRTRLKTAAALLKQWYLETEEF